MRNSPPPSRTVVLDSSVLINLIHVRALDLLGAFTLEKFVVLPEVEAEISLPEQAEALDRACRRGIIQRTTFSGMEEIEIYAELAQTLGKGEAASLAVAQIRGWIVASDERGRFLRLGMERVGTKRLLNTPGIFILAIREGLLTIEEAEHYKRLLEKHRFKMRFSSFREILDASRPDTS